MKAVIRGVFPVLPTPFTPEGAVDEPAFLRLVDFALEAGVDGLVFPGMASEVETLTAGGEGRPGRCARAARGRAHASSSVPATPTGTRRGPGEEGRPAGAIRRP